MYLKGIETDKGEGKGYAGIGGRKQRKKQTPHTYAAARNKADPHGGRAGRDSVAGLPPGMA
jgi:hypothetical protein